MAGLDPVKLSDWLRKAMLSPKLPPISQIELLHVFSTGETRTAYVWDWEENEPKPKIEEMINDVTSQAETYANGIADGTIRFMMQAFHGKSHSPWGAKFPFYIVARSPEAETAQYGASEPATGSGLLSQLMRHNERKEEMLVKTVEAQQRLVTKLLSDQQTKLDNYEHRHFDTIKLYEDMLDRKHDRELTALFRAREDQRKDKAWQLLYSIGPIVASQFLNPKLAAALPGQVTDGGPAMQIVRELAKSINEEQLPALASALSQEQLLMFMELHRIVADEVDRKNEAEEQMRHLAPSSAEDIRRERDEMLAQAQAEAEARAKVESEAQAHPEPSESEPEPASVKKGRKKG